MSAIIFFFRYSNVAGVRWFPSSDTSRTVLQRIYPVTIVRNNPPTVNRSAVACRTYNRVSTQPVVPLSFCTQESADRRRAMSENTRSSAFRKIDVDQFNENFKEDEQSEFQSPTAIPDESEITTFINQYPLTRFYRFTLHGPFDKRTQVLPISALKLRWEGVSLFFFHKYLSVDIL